jgi:hypothetical protein
LVKHIDETLRNKNVQIDKEEEKAYQTAWNRGKVQRDSWM